MIVADSGLPVWGEDYCSSKVIWAVPIDYANQNIAEFIRSELVCEMTPPDIQL